MSNVRSVNSNLMLPARDDAYGHKAIFPITYSGMLHVRSVNSNLMAPPSDDAYGHKAKLPSPLPRMRQNFNARSGRLAFLLNFP